jgi:hypothetical protein
MTLLQKVTPLCWEAGSHDEQHRQDGNHELHIPRSSKPMFCPPTERQYSRHESYSFTETPRLTKV